MFVARALLHPAPGRLAKLEEYVRGLPQSGQSIAVARSLTGPVVFSVNRQFEHLSDFEQFLKSRPSPPAQVGELLGQPFIRELWEIVVPAPAGPVPAFTTRFTYEAAPGKAAELRRTVEEFAKKRNNTSGRRSVGVLVSGGPASVAVVAAFADLAELEATRAQAIAQPDTAYLQQLAACLARLASPQIFQILATSQ